MLCLLQINQKNIEALQLNMKMRVYLLKKCFDINIRDVMPYNIHKNNEYAWTQNEEA